MVIEEILKKAWKIIWKHKILWLFGVLASCTANSARGGSHGGGSGGGPGSNPSSSASMFPFVNNSIQSTLDSFINAIETIEPWLFVIIAVIMVFVVIALSVLFLFLGTLGITGVIKGTVMADEAGPDAKSLSFGAIFKAIKPYYWKVFLLHLGLRIVGTIIILILLVPIILLMFCTCFLGLFLLIPIGWFIELMITFTTIAIIEEDLDIFKAIARAWHVITRKIGYVVVMFLILGIGELIAGLIIGLPLILVPLPLVVNLIATGFRTVSVGLFLSIGLLMLILPVLIFLGGIIKAYVLTSWTLTYRVLVGEDSFTPVVLSNQDRQELAEEQES